MVNGLLVAASTKAIEELLGEAGIPYLIDANDAYEDYGMIWAGTPEKRKEAELKKARPAFRRIFSKEPYIYQTKGEPLAIRFNDKDTRDRKESFAEILLEREDLDWRIAISIKNDAKVLATMPVADRDIATYMNNIVNVYNEIDDFGERIFGIPCSNDYFDDMNAILEKISAHDRDTWRELLRDDDFVYDSMITPMLQAIGRELPRIFWDHPGAPKLLIDYFYGKIDYYYINPIEEVGVTRIGAVNSRRGLGRIPGSPNLHTPNVIFPAELLDVRFANGRYGELSRDTIQFTFDGGWAICITILVGEDRDYEDGRNFVLDVYLPVTPFGSYRDQVKWDR